MDKLPPGDFEKFRRICGEDAPPNTTDYQRPISEFSDVLSSRAYNALLSGKIETIGDLVRHTEATLLRTPNFGRRSLLEIRELLARLGHKLGELPYEPQPVSSVS